MYQAIASTGLDGSSHAANIPKTQHLAAVSSTKTERYMNLTGLVRKLALAQRHQLLSVTHVQTISKSSKSSKSALLAGPVDLMLHLALLLAKQLSAYSSPVKSREGKRC